MSTFRPAQRDPSTLYFQKGHVRWSILASYWAFIIFSLPFWWYTTTIERLSLPTSRVLAQAKRELGLPVYVKLECETSLVDVSPASLVNDLQTILDNKAHTQPRWKGVEAIVFANASHGIQDSVSTYTVNIGRKPVSVRGRSLSFPFDEHHTVHSLADILTDMLVPYTQENTVVQYAPRYRLAFSLLNEDSSEGAFAMGWDVRRAIHDHITPLMKSLSILHNFTVESQVQFHAPLAFDPQVRSLPQGDRRILTPEDLTVFINSADWTLSSGVSNDPVLHFILFVPSRPLQIVDKNSLPSASSAFLIPQWGGVVLLNPPEGFTDRFYLTSTHLDPVFSAFASQFIALLGIPGLPGNLQSTEAVTSWQFDALIRRRTLENIHNSQETLRSIVQLADKIESMPIAENVRGNISDALFALNMAYATSSPILLLQYSSKALSSASRAFFDPGMLAMLYFPPEHKYAVYAPLFASTMIPLVIALLREVTAWRRNRRHPEAEKEKEQ